MLKLDEFNLKKEDKIICAVSGGPDSMALLDLLVQAHFKPVVCHVNYHKRASSKRDELIVSDYCNKHSLVFELLDVKEKQRGNFQNWARELRYHFFKEIYDKVQAQALLVAHQEDDLIETYLFKKARKSVGDYLGLASKEEIFGMTIIRPLLEQPKKALIEYCVSRGIQFGEDESNFQKNYTRNRIRLEIVEKLSEQERAFILRNIELEEKAWQKKRAEALEILIDNKISVTAFLKKDEEQKHLLLYHFIVRNCPDIARSVSTKRLKDLSKQLSSDKQNIVIKLNNEKCLVKSYDILEIKARKVEGFSYQISKLVETDYPQFSLRFNGPKKLDGIHVFESDFPLTIRSPKADDYLSLKSGHKSLRRLFIDKKIPVMERKNWPVVVNSKKEIIHIPGLYRFSERKTLQNNLYVLKCTSQKGED
ncbi:MAG: tRNA lysidine(34) synthetase TilS [Bacilli bacterium]|jgi:bifunctional protein TilS/HprT